MKEIKLEAKKYRITYEGAECVFRKPTIGEQKEFERKLQQVRAENGDEGEAVLEFLALMGLNREFLDRLDIDAFQALASEIAPAKKN